MSMSEDMQTAWRFISETNTSLFLTGKAGTGKTTFLRKLRELSPKRMVVLAPTGVAAINANGQTIHSFFQLPLGPIVPDTVRKEMGHYRMSQDKKNLIRTLDLLVIDEISMVRCDVLDAIDAEMRKYRDHYKPFGGVQLLLIGDLQQLAPVTREQEWEMLRPYYQTPYFFGSRALQQTSMVTIELQHIYRQQDADFINILAQIRENRLDDATLARLNERYNPNFVIPEGEDWIRLTTHNKTAQDYNDRKLTELESEAQTFHAEVRQNFPESNYPADEFLTLKVGAQVMFIKNDPTSAHEYYNGKIGVVHEILDEGIVVFTKEDEAYTVVPRLTWENTKYSINPETKEIREEVEGTFTQYPLRLAWAITVHKSQGLTFDHAVLDINASFAHGQVYVALSRCRTLQGLVLSAPLAKYSVISDQSVNHYISSAKDSSNEKMEHLPEMREEYFALLLDECFDFLPLRKAYDYLVRVVDEHLYNSRQEYLAQLKQVQPLVEQNLQNIGMRFQPQYRIFMRENTNYEENAHLQERVHAAMTYFEKQLHIIFDNIIQESAIRIDNKTISTQYNNALESFTAILKTHLGIYRRLATEPFSVTSYLRAKAEAVLDELTTNDAPKKKSRNSQKKAEEKTPAEKRQKGDSQRQTLMLYKSGLTLKEIAETRHLSVSTIESHLAGAVKDGHLHLNDLVSQEHQQLIRQAVSRQKGSYTLSDLREALPDEISYASIKMTLAHDEAQNY